MRLADSTTITTGHAFRGRIPTHKGSGIRAIQMRDTTATGGILWESLVETEPATSRPEFLREGDILLAKHGARNYAVLISGAPGGCRHLAAPHWFVIRCQLDQLLPGFLAWQLNRAPAQAWLQRHATGSNTPILRRRAVEDLPIAVPPLARQKAIIGIAQTMLRERELLEELMASTESLNDGLARQLLDNVSREEG